MIKAVGTVLLCWLTLLATVAGARADKRVALVVGVSAYQNAPMLPNPVRDARAMAAMFQKSGFDVVSALYDTGNLQFKRAIREFEDAATGADIAVIYFAGHGIEIHGVNYLVPADAKLASDRDADDEAITLDRLLASLDGAKNLRLIILDACRDDPFVRKMRQQRSAALRGIYSGLATIEPTTSDTLIAYAAKSGAAADDGQADHSPFTAALLNNLFVPGLDVRLALGRARDEVLKKTANKQEPFVYGSIGGANISIVPAPEQSPQAAERETERQDYARIEKIGTKRAWQMFLEQYPRGFYADLARESLAAIERAEQAEKERLAKEQAEKERLAKEQAEKEWLAREKAEQQRLAAERARLAAEQAEKDRLAKQQAEVERLAKEQAEQQRLAAERARLAAEQAEKERLAKQQAEEERLAKEQAERQRLAAERARLAAEQAEKERLAKEQAEKDRLALLTPSTTPSPATAPAQPPDNLIASVLVVAIKNELHRLGCYSGEIDDQWPSAETTSSLTKFAKYAKLSAIPANPDKDLLITLRGKTDRICPLECGAREVSRNDQCVAKSCPTGTVLDNNGGCIKAPKKTATLTDEKSSPEPNPNKGGPGIFGQCNASSCSQAYNGCLRKCAALGKTSCPLCSGELSRCMQTGTFIGRFCQHRGLARN